MYISSVNIWASGDFPLAQLVKEVDLCLYLCVIKRLWDRNPVELINNKATAAAVTSRLRISNNGELKEK